MNSKQYTFGSRQVGKVSCGYVRNCRLVGSKVGNYTEKEDNYDEDYNPSDEEGEGKKSEHFVKYYNDVDLLKRKFQNYARNDENHLVDFASSCNFLYKNIEGNHLESKTEQKVTKKGFEN